MLRDEIRRILASPKRATAVRFRVVLADGTALGTDTRAPDVSIVFRRSSAEMRTALFGHVGLLESYFTGDVDVEGDLALAFRAALDMGLSESPKWPVRIRNRWHELRRSNRRIDRAKENARFHYGLGQDFYRQWLDLPAMMYTCAYWTEGTRTLEQAQRNKMDHVCRKVRMAPGETFVDVGCGWGGLLFHALEHYGALGTGINTTTEQVAELSAEIERRGVRGRIAVLERDFREIPGQYDKLLSIGTLEHAGRDQVDDVVRAHAQALKPRGLGVIHFIGHVGQRPTEFYIRKHVFPGGWIPSLTEVLDAMERHGLEVLDVENLRRHYSLTLDCWAQRFDRNWDAIRAIDPRRFDECFRRTWRTYLWSCAEMFRSPHSRTHLFQVTVSKGNVDARHPMTREHLYRVAAPAPARAPPDRALAG